MKKLPPDYRPTLKEMDAGFKLMAKYFADVELTEDQQYLADLLTDAHYIYTRTGKRPTVGQVHAHWVKEAKESHLRRIFSWRDNLEFTEKYFAEFATEEPGPLTDFLNAAKTLKSKTGKYPTVGDVRKALKV
jgi:ABC-type glycerol-3-phosphate transport system substrate-binding protein